MTEKRSQISEIQTSIDGINAEISAIESDVQNRETTRANLVADLETAQANFDAYDAEVKFAEEIELCTARVSEWTSL